MKHLDERRCASPGCRSPQGERGLKRGASLELILLRGSLPARGAWVETVLTGKEKR